MKGPIPLIAFKSSLSDADAVAASGALEASHCCCFHCLGANLCQQGFVDVDVELDSEGCAVGVDVVPEYGEFQSPPNASFFASGVNASVFLPEEAAEVDGPELVFFF